MSNIPVVQVTDNSGKVWIVRHTKKKTIDLCVTKTPEQYLSVVDPATQERKLIPFGTIVSAEDLPDQS